MNTNMSDVDDENNKTLVEWAVQILKTSNIDEKARLTTQVFNTWNDEKITCIHSEQDENPLEKAPEHPARPANIKTVTPSTMPRRGKAGSLISRQAMIHSLVHIESVAIDLSWDIIARFHNMYNLPREFYNDWIKVASDEAKHYRMLSKRLTELGASYGDFPTHDGLWESAQQTSHDLLARLCIEHMVHEARGLDAVPKTISRFKSAGDKESAYLLEEILKDEITHVTAGMKWFCYLCEHTERPKTPILTFHQMVRENFRGNLKPPFNTEGRSAAGMTPEWYLPLAS